MTIFTRATSVSCQSTKNASKPMHSVVARTFHKVDLESVFSDYNKTYVQTKLDAAMPLLRPPAPAKPQSPKSEAAVLVPLCFVAGEPSILFMMRSRDLNSHSGEICFPGGKKDSSDRDLVHTALRETHEEIGLSREHIDVWGKLPPSPTSRSGGQVTPVLGFCGNYEDKTWKINKKEVQEIFTRSIASLCDSDNVRTTQFRYGSGYTMPVFFGLSAEYRIWGLTAVILHQVLSTIAPGIYNFKVKHKH